MLRTLDLGRRDEPGADARFDAAVEAAVAVMDEGGAVVLPTDTVYGLGVRADRADAVARIWVLKDRPAAQPLAVLVADVAQGLALAAPDAGDLVRAWTARWWPGPLTLVLRRSPAAADLDLGGDPTTIGVRCPADPLVQAIAARVGPLAVTSANRHGHPTPPSAREAAEGLAVPPDLVIDGGPTGSVASTVVDATDPSDWRVLRVGAVTEADLAAALA